MRDESGGLTNLNHTNSNHSKCPVWLPTDSSSLTGQVNYRWNWHTQSKYYAQTEVAHATPAVALWCVIIIVAAK